MMVAAAKEKNLTINAYIIRAIENAEFDKALDRRMSQIEADIRELQQRGVLMPPDDEAKS